MMSFPKVFIVILNYNGKNVIKRCLTSVFKIDYPNFEVVIVDNNSIDGSFEIAKSTFSKASFIKNEKNIGFSAGNNIGIRFALERMADYVLILNPDTEVEESFLKRLVDEGEKNIRVGILSPIIFKGEARDVWFSGGKINWLRMKSIHQKNIKKENKYETRFITGCAMLIRAEVFKKIGLFDEDFFLYWEDADFSFRAKRAGFKLLIVSASWIYHTEESEKSNKNKIYWLVFSGLLFFKKNTSFFLRPWIFILVFFRKIKNKYDLLRKKRNREAIKMVQKAYADFDEAKNNF